VGLNIKAWWPSLADGATSQGIGIAHGVGDLE
jgi:hypothetical protein